MLKIDDILHCINSRTKFSYEKIQKIKLEDISFEEDFINATAMSHQKGILYIGTAKGKLHYFDLNQNKKIKTLTINKQRSLQHPQFSNTQSTQCISDICISQQQNESYAIISTKNGRILIYNLQFGNLSIQIKLKRKINNIRKMVLIQEQGKLFTIHQNQVVEWNISLRIQLRSYKCVYSSSVCKLKNSGQILIGGLSNNVLIYKRDFNNESSSLNQDKNIQMEVSMRSVNVIKELISKDNLVIFGGGDNLIDVYKNGVRLTTLYAM